MNFAQFPLPIVLWSWGGRFPDDRITTLQNMLTRHLKIPHRYVIISDSPVTLSRFHAEGCQTIPLWSELRDVGGKCLVRLKIFHPMFAHIIGPRFAWIDLDMVAVSDVTPLFTRTEDFVISGVELRPQPYNGSLVLMDAGARSKVYDTFDPHRWRSERLAKRYGGSDQAWIAICLGEKEATWGREDGLFCFRDDVAPREAWDYQARLNRGCIPLENPTTNGKIPSGARLIQMNGPWSPWEPRVQAIAPWVKDHWC